MKVSAVILAHNEMRSVGEVIRSCMRYCDEVIVVDDGSTDGTAAVSAAAGAIVIRNRWKSGIVRTTEIEIPAIVRPISQDLADLVLGVRDSGIPLSELVISRIINRRVRCNDTGTGYRAFRKEQRTRLDSGDSAYAEA